MCRKGTHCGLSSFTIRCGFDESWKEVRCVHRCVHELIPMKNGAYLSRFRIENESKTHSNQKVRKTIRVGRNSVACTCKWQANALFGFSDLSDSSLEYSYLFNHCFVFAFFLSWATLISFDSFSFFFFFVALPLLALHPHFCYNKIVCICVRVRVSKMYADPALSCFDLQNNFH